MSQRQCLCCRVRFTPVRNPNQRYCSKPVCQKQRRRKYQKQKLKADPDYRENQRAAERNWHKRHPDYWRNYRKSHPEQAEKNAKQQLKRNQKRLKSSYCCGVSQIATMYAFNAINIDLS